MSKRGQSALEFLTTYSWAMLVVLVVIGILAYLGIVNLSGFLQENCIVGPGISCSDFNVETSRIILVLQNNFGETITIDKIEVAKKNGGSCYDTSSLRLENNQKVIFTILGCNNGNVGEKFDGDLDITYTKERLLSHSMKGSILARITTGSTTSSSSICQTAEDDGLCGGLDLLFGIGYKDACCSEHGLCC